MKPVVFQKTGYSFKDIFNSLAKYLIFILVFLFVGIICDEDTIMADVSIRRTTGAHLTEVSASASDGKGGYTTYPYNHVGNYTYYVARFYMYTTDTGTSPKSIYVKATSSSSAIANQSLTSVLREEYINIVYMDRTGTYNCGHSYTSICSSAPSGFSYYGLTVLVPYSYMSKSMVVGGTGSKWSLLNGTTNYSAESTVKITDKTGPDTSGATISYTAGKNNVWSKKLTVKVTGTIRDHYTGSTITSLNLCKYSVGPGYGACSSSSSGIKFSPGGNGYTFSTNANDTYIIRAFDSSGNYNGVGTGTVLGTEIQVKVDTTAPTLSGTFTMVDADLGNNYIYPSIGYTNSYKVKVGSLPTVTDTGGSGIWMYTIYDDSDIDLGDSIYHHASTTGSSLTGNATAPTTSAYGYLKNGSGSHTVVYEVCDSAENCSEVSFTIIVDITAPTINSFSITDGDLSNNHVTPLIGHTNSDNVIINQSSSDNQGINIYQIINQSSGDNWYCDSNNPNGLTKTINNGTNIYYIQFEVYDYAGNKSMELFELYYFSAPMLLIDESTFNVCNHSTCDLDAVFYTNSMYIWYGAVYYDVSSYYNWYPNGMSYMAKLFDGNVMVHQVDLSDAGRVTSEVLSYWDISLASDDEGAHLIKLCLYDKAGNQNCAEETIYYDETAPSASGFTIIGNENALLGYTSQTDVLINLDNAADNRSSTYNSGLSVISIEVYAPEWYDYDPAAYTESCENGNVCIPKNVPYDLLPISDLITFTIYVFDKAGNLTRIEFDIYYDPYSPDIYEFNVIGNDTAMDGFTNQAELTVVLDAEDAETGLNRYVITVDSHVVYESNINPTGKTIVLPDTTLGTKKFSISVRDYAGNIEIRTNTLEIIFDNVAPTLDSFVIVGNEDASLGFTNTEYLKVIVTGLKDNLSGIQDTFKMYDFSVEVGWGVLAHPNNYEFELEDNTLGAHKYRLTIYDKAGNELSETYTIIYDNVAPVVGTFTIIGNALADSGYTNILDFTINTTGNQDALSGLKDSFAIYDNSTNNRWEEEGNPNGFEFSVSDRNYGSYRFTLYIYDKAGNVGQKTYSINYITPIIITTFSVYDNDYSNGTGVNGYTNSTSLVVSMIYTSMDVKNLVIYEEGEELISDTYDLNNKVINLLSSSYGHHVLTLVATDKAGNEDTISAHIYFDNIKPVIEEFSVVGNEGAWCYMGHDAVHSGCYTNTREVKVSQSSYDEHTELRYMIRDMGYGIYGFSEDDPHSKSINLLNTQNRVHALTLYVYDQAGNYTSADFDITLDTVSPDIKTSFSAIDADSSNGVGLPGYTNSAKLQLFGDFTESHLMWVIVYDNGEEVFRDVGGLWPEMIISNTSDKTHELLYEIYDLAGNMVAQTYTIIYDDELPGIKDFFTKGNADAVCDEPYEECYTNQLELTVTLDAIDDTAIREYYIHENGSEYYFDINSPDGELIELEGEYIGNRTITILLTDLAGNAVEGTFDIYFDNVRPEVTSFTLKGNDSAQSGYTNQLGLTPSQTSYDLDSGKYRYEILEAGRILYNRTIDPTAQTIYLSENAIDGAKELTLRVYDRAGNVSEITEDSKYTIVLDRVKQEVRLNNEVSELKDIIRGTELRVTVTDPDYHDRTSTYEVGYYISVEDKYVSGSTYKLNTNNLNSYIKAMDYVGTYYIYVFIDKTDVSKLDKAGNAIRSDFEDGNYLIRKFKITGKEATEQEKLDNPYVSPMDNMWVKLEEKSFIVTGLQVNELRTDKDTGMLYATDNTESNIIQVQDNRYLIITLNDLTCNGSGTNPEIVNILNSLELKLAGMVISTTTGTAIHLNRLLSYENTFSVLSIIVIDNTPRISCAQANVVSSQTIEQGSDISNIGLSYMTSTDDMEVTTVITLNGVKVEKVDTNIADVYNIRQVAKDAQGRVKRLQREIIVEARIEEKVEEVVETIEVLEEVELEVVLTQVQEEVKVQEKVEVENTNKVEMRIENKEEVIVYNKKKDTKKNKNKKSSESSLDDLTTDGESKEATTEE